MELFILSLFIHCMLTGLGLKPLANSIAVTISVCVHVCVRTNMVRVVRAHAHMQVCVCVFNLVWIMSSQLCLWC